MIPNKWTFRNKDKVIDLSTVESGVYVLDHSDTGLPEVRSELRPRIDLIGSTSSGNRYEARRFVLVVRITSKSPVENMRKLRRLLDDMNPMNKAGIISDGVMSRLSPDGVELNIKCRLINGFDLQARHRRQSTWTYTAPFVFLAEDPRWYTVHPKTVEETVVKTGLMTGVSAWVWRRFVRIRGYGSAGGVGLSGVISQVRTLRSQPEVKSPTSL